MPIAAGLGIVAAIMKFAGYRDATRRRVTGIAVRFRLVDLLPSKMEEWEGISEHVPFDMASLHLTNWVGNVIMPTLAAFFFIIAILHFSRGLAHYPTMYGGFLCLMGSGLVKSTRDLHPAEELERPRRVLGFTRHAGELDCERHHAALCGS